MTELWSTWVIVLVVVNLGITVFLFLWGLRVACLLYTSDAADE